MGIPALCTIFIMVIAISLTSGCIGQNSDEFSSSSQSDTTMAKTTEVSNPPTQVPVTPIVKISDLAITREEVPFPVVAEQAALTPVDKSKSEPYTSAVQAYTQGYSSEAMGSPTATIFMQVIIEYPFGGATQAFAELEKHLQKSDETSTILIRLQDPKVGDQSVAFTAVERSGSDSNPFTTIIFRKANIIEIISLKTRNADMETLSGLAKTAASRIPSSGTNPGTIPLPLPTAPGASTTVPRVSAASPAVSALEFVGPVSISPVSQNSFDKIMFSLKVNEGSNAVDMSRAEYTVSTSNDFWIARSGDPTIKLSWVKNQGPANMVLESGEIVDIELDTSDMDAISTNTGTSRTLNLEIKPSIGAALGKTCNLPSSLKVGTDFECP
jgi:hypothetical protein